MSLRARKIFRSNSKGGEHTIDRANYRFLSQQAVEVLFEYKTNTIDYVYLYQSKQPTHMILHLILKKSDEDRQ